MVKEAMDIVRQQGMKKEYTSKDETPIETVIECLAQIVFDKKNDLVIDAGSGKNEIWYKNIPTDMKIAIEIDNGCDFLTYNEKTDWVVGNPPFHEWLLFLFHSVEISNKGIGFLINHTRLNQLTPHRLNKLKEKGFYLNHIHIIEVKKWFGRYYFLIFTKDQSKSITWKGVKCRNSSHT